MTLPQPDDQSSLVLRCDFGDDRAWTALVATLSDDDLLHATYVSDPRFDGVGVQALLAENGADADTPPFYLFLADRTALGDPSFPLLAVDLSDDPGRTFRIPAQYVPEVAVNLAICNMDFAEFATGADASGTYRGFSGE
ncbi:DUF6924 domain-containing protein [Streptomyces uncialis]|uniref:DUF6924 domain-containing protein n=1 Tax=Streptomyces uncialis TaxID=1048205 RepID=UPI00381421F0